MMNRALTPRARRSYKYDEDSCRSMSIHEYEEFMVGFKEDVPLKFCDQDRKGKGKLVYQLEEAPPQQITLKEALRASVGVLGESPLGMTEKVVLLGGKTCAVKRFRMVVVKRVEFGRRVEMVAQISSQCEFLVPLFAYLYAKRIKLVVSDYYPMGSLADLLSGARERGQTALEWGQRLQIVVSIAQAIAFIHSQPHHSHKDKDMYLNIHGNIKSSNVMVNVDFTARLADYGFAQLAARTDHCGTPHLIRSNFRFSETLSQKSDVYNFGVILLDVLGIKKSDVIKKGKMMMSSCFEFDVEGKEKRQALGAWDIALACTKKLPEERPDMEQVLALMYDVKKVTI
ncbi:PREDICTED: probable inactive receptor kinase At3g08680 [Ipomoea nil]|uniref:probable inactive receptor kinase At3g08680 n=1 Tax=Ipomoea nil TaxID=35883 RepID=UPI000901541D|nr:PREDICTED: probable inactive receptor kinase At3g08680 [Ipomoea nil]